MKWYWTVMVCNGHGLRWNVETGELVPRVPVSPCREP